MVPTPSPGPQCPGYRADASYTEGMRRLIVGWTAVAAAIVALWIGGVSWLNQTVYSPASTVEAYLGALEVGDTGRAVAIAELAKIPPVAPDPTELPRDVVVSGIQQVDEAVVLVQADYTLAGEQERTVFTLRQAPSIWGLFHQWSFDRSPTATVMASVDGLDRMTLNGLTLPGNTDTSTEVLVPGVYTVHAASQWLEAPSYTTTLDEPGSEWEIDLDVAPTDALLQETADAINAYLVECASRQVLKPSSCPFGVTVVDRLWDLPVWSIDSVPSLSLVESPVSDTWLVRALDGEVSVSVTLQSLFDGSLRPYTESVTFSLTGEVTGLDSSSPALRID